VQPQTAGAKGEQPLNRWITLDPAEGNTGSFADWKLKQPDVRDGILRMRHEWLSFERTVFADGILRCQISVPQLGSGAGLVLRGSEDGAYHAWFGPRIDRNKPVGYWHSIEKGIGRGQNWKLEEIPGGRVSTKDVPNGFIEIRFSVVGDRLTLTVDGQKKLDVRDSRHTRGWAGFNMHNKSVEIKDIEMKIMGK
jgi:3-keto-disaccharide hydrolase